MHGLIMKKMIERSLFYIKVFSILNVYNEMSGFSVFLMLSVLRDLSKQMIMRSKIPLLIAVLLFFIICRFK